MLSQALMRLGLVGALALATALAQKSCADLTRYPPLWSCDNGTQGFAVSVNMTNPSDAPLHPRWQFEYWFDGAGKQERYDHGQGHRDEVCAMSRVSNEYAGEPCTVLYSHPLKATFIYLPRLVQDDVPAACCVCHYSILGPLRMDWLQTGGTKYAGEKLIRGYHVDEWLKFGASDNHLYCTVASQSEALSHPVRYMEHKNGILKQWDFDLTTFRKGAPDGQVFSPPRKCNTICESAKCKQGEAQSIAFE